MARSVVPILLMLVPLFAFRILVADMEDDSVTQETGLCQVGQELHPGQSCILPYGDPLSGSEASFVIREDGMACLTGGSINLCSGRAITIQNFKATRLPDEPKWRIDGL